MTSGTHRALPTGLLLLLLFGCGRESTTGIVVDSPVVNPQDLRVLYGLGPAVPPDHPLYGRRIVILDTRAKAAFDQGHLRSAARFDVADRASTAGQSDNACVVVYAESKEEALAAATTLRNRGWTNVFMLQGGLAAAILAGLPVDATPVPALAAIAAKPPPELHGSASTTPYGRQITGTNLPGKPTLRIIATSDLRSVLEGCGCGASGLGVARMATLLRGLKVDGVPTLVVNTGTLFTGTDKLDRRRCLHFLGIMKSLGYQAAVAGTDTGRFGLDFLRGQLVDSPVPLLSANLTIDGARPFTAKRMVEIASVRIAIVGVTVPCSANSRELVEREGMGGKRAGMGLPKADELPGIELADVLATLGPILDSAAKEADLIIVDGNIPIDLAEKISQLPVAPSLILSSSAPTTAQPSLIGGKVRHADGNDEMIMMFDPHVRRERTSIFFADGRAGNSVYWIDLSLDEKKLLAEPGYGLALGNIEQTAKDPDVNVLVQSFLDQVRSEPEMQEHLVSRLTGLELESDPNNGYVGQEACAKCHEKETEHWKRTPHAGAYKVLEKVDRTYYPGCLSCHTTGAGHSRGYVPGVPGMEKLQGVQCETCHGPGARHVEEPKRKGLTRRAAGRGLCMRCHDGIEGEAFADDELFSLAHHYMSHLDPGTDYFTRKAAQGK